MADLTDFYINGSWISPSGADALDVINPATEEPVGQISLGSADDVDAAVTAARAAFPVWSSTTVAERKAALERLTDVYRARSEEMAVAISTEMGAPISMSTRAQVGAGLGHLMSFIAAIDEVEWTEVPDPASPEHQLLREPIGVAALITPWNWPMNQVVLKVGAALAAGCTMVLKPSEIAPLSSMLFAEFVDAAELPAGVFNLVNGDGATAGSALTSHPEIDVISFTGFDPCRSAHLPGRGREHHRVSRSSSVANLPTWSLPMPISKRRFAPVSVRSC